MISHAEVSGIDHEFSITAKLATRDIHSMQCIQDIRPIRVAFRNYVCSAFLNLYALRAIFTELHHYIWSIGIGSLCIDSSLFLRTVLILFFFSFYFLTSSGNSGWARVSEYLLSRCSYRFSTIPCKASSKLHGVSNGFLRLVIIFYVGTRLPKFHCLITEYCIVSLSFSSTAIEMNTIPVIPERWL